jgi:site-specific DNA-methyltransferase (adenine-specific)
MKHNYNIYNADCKEALKYLEPESVDLMICDPPFGINEASFDKHYKRKKDKVLDGYIEAPKDYYKFSCDWIAEAKTVLKRTGSLYIISGWSNLNDILNAVKAHGLYTQNHIIWKYNFGVHTKKKFVTSHYHILYLLKDEHVEHTFNQYCRFGPDERDGGSLNYQDMEDVWVINKEFAQGKNKNTNKLPDALVNKMIMYSSNEKDVVCDFFQGNFTTAMCAAKLGRIPTGFELNKVAYDRGMNLLEKTDFGSNLQVLRIVPINKLANQGKSITPDERYRILSDFESMTRKGDLTKKNILEQLSEKYGRGKFSLINITEENKITIEEIESLQLELFK